jgi:hypothetical protein
MPQARGPQILLRMVDTKLRAVSNVPSLAAGGAIPAIHTVALCKRYGDTIALAGQKIDSIL